MAEGQVMLRPVIAASWQRVRLAGLEPGVPVRNATLGTVNPKTRLMRAAGPILDEIGTALRGTEFMAVLADRHSQLTDVRSGNAAVRDRIERLGLIAGRHLGEESIGTNSLATAAEVGTGVLVHGTEHFIEDLKPFSCYGHPIVHPLTRRLEGVLDITGPTTAASPLLVPFVIAAVRRIEDRLLADSRTSEQQLLLGFQRASARDRTVAVAAVGSDAFFANNAAVEMLGPADHAILRGLAADSPTEPAALRLTLVSGRAVEMCVEQIGDGAVFVFRPTGSRVEDPARTTHGHVVVCGEPGSGRTTAAQTMIGARERVSWFDSADIVTSGAGAWLLRVAGRFRVDDAVVVEAVNLLPEAVARQLAGVLRSGGARAVLTCSPTDGLGHEQAGLIAHCAERVDLRPLRSHREEIPNLVLSMLAELDAPRELRWTPAALEALAAHEWPGNHSELRTVVRHVVQTRRIGDVTVQDLPERYRRRTAPRRLTPMERAEHDAIVEVLRATNGNKVAAAQQLGISRTTLYRAIRQYGIVPPVSTD